MKNRQLGEYHKQQDKFLFFCGMMQAGISRSMKIMK